MTRRPRRQRLLIGALLAAVAIWAVDRMIGTGQPPPAAAGPSGSGSAAPPVEWSDVAGLIEHLTKREYHAVSDELAGVQRDIFVPTPLVDATFNQIAARWAAEQAAESETDTPPEPGFEARHALDAVMVGRQPRAVVDSRLLAIGDELDGHRLVEIHRDQVVFQNIQNGELVALELQRRPKNH